VERLLLNWVTLVGFSGSGTSQRATIERTDSPLLAIGLSVKSLDAAVQLLPDVAPRLLLGQQGRSE
jgi:hypothetical protein